MTADSLCEMKIVWKIKSFDELSSKELFEIFRLRQAVFVVEQACAYPDIDDVDKQALHFCGWDDRRLAGYARLIAPGISHEYASVGRVVIAPEFRSSGLGRRLMRASLEKMQALFPDQAIKIGAQHHLEAFYQSLGFNTISEVYLDDGIPHIDMLRDPMSFS